MALEMDFPASKSLRPAPNKQHTVTRTIQNEALLWKIAVLGMQKAPRRFWNILSLSHTVILHSSMLEISSGLWSMTFSVLLQENSVRATN
jgi:hypothetical protein